MKLPTLAATTIALFLFTSVSLADEAKRKKSENVESAAADVYIKIPDIEGETTRAAEPTDSAEMNKGEVISEIASKPVEPAKSAEKSRRAASLRPKAVAVPSTPQADGDDNSNTKSGSINTIRADCTLEEKLKGDKICKKD